MRDGKKFDASNKSNDKQAKAIHIEVAREHSLAARTMFSALYGSSVNSFLLDIWMRYVITPSPSLTAQMRDGAATLRHKQVWVPESIEHGQSCDILDLDTIIKDHSLSLRSMIMKINSKEDKQQLFMSVNEDKFGDGHFFTFRKSKESKARNMIVQFGSYLIHLYSETIISSLIVPVATRATSSPWDVEAHCAKSPEDESLQQLVTLADGMDWLKSPQVAAPVILKPPEQQKFNKKSVGFQFNPDTSSIATFNPKKNQESSPSEKSVGSNDAEDDMDVASSGESISTDGSDNDGNETSNNNGNNADVINLSGDDVAARIDDGVPGDASSSVSPSSPSGAGGGVGLVRYKNRRRHPLYPQRGRQLGPETVGTNASQEPKPANTSVTIFVKFPKIQRYHATIKLVTVIKRKENKKINLRIQLFL